MSDLVAKLRYMADVEGRALAGEAADRIEQLEGFVRDWMVECGRLVKERDKALAEPVLPEVPSDRIERP